MILFAIRSVFDITGMRRLLFGLLALLYVSSGFCQVRIPNWASVPANNEYIGISLPDCGVNQAVAVALFSYVLEHDIDCSYVSYSSCESKLIDDDFPVVDDRVSDSFTYSGVIKYDIVRKILLSSGETVVAIADGNTHADTVKIAIRRDLNEIEGRYGRTSEEVVNIGLRFPDQEWTLTINDKTGSSQEIMSEYTMACENSPIHHSHIYPADDKVFCYKFANSAELDKRERTSAMPLLCAVGTNSRIPLSGNLINSLCGLLWEGCTAASVQSARISGVFQGEIEGGYIQKVELENRYATPIGGFIQRDNTHFLLLSN